MESVVTHEADLNLEATELRLGLPGRENEPVNDQSWSLRVNKRASHQMLSSTEESNDNSNSTASDAANGGSHHAIESSPPSKAQVVGWPPIRSYRKNNLQVKKSDAEVVGMFVKVSMDGAPYLRKIDLKLYQTYSELLKGLEDLFKFTISEYSEREGYNGSEYVPTYEDKDGDWMLVGDVPVHRYHFQGCFRCLVTTRWPVLTAHSVGCFCLESNFYT